MIWSKVRFLPEALAKESIASSPMKVAEAARRREDAIIESKEHAITNRYGTCHEKEHAVARIPPGTRSD